MTLNGEVMPFLNLNFLYLCFSVSVSICMTGYFLIVLIFLPLAEETLISMWLFKKETYEGYKCMSHVIHSLHLIIWQNF